MCFSATASFTAAGILVPAGLYCLKKSNEIDRRYWAFAMLPLLFGIQQLLEGGVWAALIAGEAAAARGFAFGFLFFSHFMWLGWIPYSSYLTESRMARKRLFLVMTWIGVLMGSYMYGPLLFKFEWMAVSIARHAIDYDLVFALDTYLSQQAQTGFYGVVILLPLLLASDRYHKVLGGMALVSALITLAFFDWVFISVWCYFAAAISLYIFFLIARRVHEAALPEVSV
ncbi:MAG: hypothetical protein KUG71_03820 [Porticoccaceae bacterium]|nr:hypothetical protein [Porticoccaceae bacterium]